MNPDNTEPSGMPPATGTFLGVIVTAYALLAFMQGSTDISAETIADWGGIMPLEWMKDEYWRLLGAGFLHFSLMHVMANTICLLAWGVPLERLMGSVRLAILFLVAIIAGSLTSILMRSEPFIGAGASGGTSGLLGALFMLWVLRKIWMPASFFVINIGLNIAVALFAPGVDWQAHLGGFVAGMLLAVVLFPADRPRGA